jgi:hypothetical protein
VTQRRIPSIDPAITAGHSLGKTLPPLATLTALGLRIAAKSPASRRIDRIGEAAEEHPTSPHDTFVE